MKKTTILFIIIFNLNSIVAQVQNNIHELNSMEDLLTEDVKRNLDTNLEDKKVVFLGESNHYVGSDLLAKTEFVKYLVLEKGYKDIAFEADFFSLYYDHNKSNLYPFWSKSVQCKELFDFLEDHEVTIWGFDNQLNAGYTYHNFTSNLTKFFNDNSINVDKRFIELTDNFFQNTDRNNSSEIVGKSNLEYLIEEIDQLLKNSSVIQDQLWTQFLESYKSYIMISSTHNITKEKTFIRDSQMGKNLDFLVNSMPDKKIIVWLHNAHMAKYDTLVVPGENMGAQFVKSNPITSYHIAFSAIHMPYRKSRRINRDSNDESNLLNLLPTTEKNYFMDARQIISDRPEYADKEFEGMFYVKDDKVKTNWLKQYDALVFISKGEEVKLIE